MSNTNNDQLNSTVLQIDTLNEMTAEEFRRNFFAWFEDRGLVSELRTHLRRQMVDSLRNTSLGVALSQMHLTGSLRTQIINLLIAEYLLDMKYCFSLSVFSTEVPFINIFPECRLWLNEQELGNERERYFTEQKIFEILELLGFARESQVSKKVSTLYFGNEEHSLLTCIIRLLRDYTKEKASLKNLQGTSTSTDYLNALDPWLKDIYNLLINFDIPTDILHDIINHLKSIFSTEQEKIKLAESTKFNLLQSQIQKDLQKRELEISKLITELEQAFLQEKEKMLEDFAKEQSEINVVKQNALKCETEIKDKIKVLKKREEVIKERETEVVEQINILKTRIKLLQDAYDSVIEENIKLNNIRQELSHQVDGNMQESNESREMLRLEYEHLRKEIKDTKDTIHKFGQTLTNKNATNETQTDTSQDLLMQVKLERLETENSQLNDVNIALQHRIQRLTSRNTKLVQEIENLLDPLRVLQPRATTVIVPPLPPAPSTLAARQHASGGGENLSFARQAQTQHSAEYRRTVPSRLIIHNNSDSNSPTPTDEILQEARLRLRSLERASADVERKYNEFRQRQLHVKSNTLISQPMQHLASAIRDQTLRNNLQGHFNTDRKTSHYINSETTNDTGLTRNFLHQLYRHYETPQNTAPTYTNITFPNINQADFYTSTPHEPFTNNPNVTNRYQVSREACSSSYQNRPSTSYNRNNQDDIVTTAADNCPSTPPHSGDSSGIHLPSQNLSISSVDISSDYPEGHDDKSPVKD